MTDNDNKTEHPTSDVQDTTQTSPEPDTDQQIDDMVQAARSNEEQGERNGDDNDTITIPRTTFNYIVVAVVFLVVGVLIGSFVFPASGGNGTAALPEDFDNRVRVVVSDVLQEAGFSIGGVEEGDRYEVTYDEDDPYRGNPDGPITIVEFSDFLCGYCGRFAQETLPTLMDEYGDQVRFVYRDFPIISPQGSTVVALAAECAQDQDKFWEYHDVLFENSGNISSADMLYSFAEDLELDMDEFRQCFDNGEHLQEINADGEYARELGLRGTPGFFINGRFVNGAVPIDTFREIIDEELAEIG